MSSSLNLPDGHVPVALLRRPVPKSWQFAIGFLCGIPALLLGQLLGADEQAMPLAVFGVALAGSLSGLFGAVTAAVIVIAFQGARLAISGLAGAGWFALLAVCAIGTAVLTGWIRDLLVELDGELSGAQALLQGTLRRLENAQEAAQKRAYYDVLTSLPTRRLVVDRFEQVLSQARRTETLVALMLFDIDQFREVNDMVGHDGGDEVLRQVGQRLSSVIRREDTVGRLDGNTFIVVMTGLTAEAGVTIAWQKIAEELAVPFEAGAPERAVHLSATRGIAVYPRDGDNWDQLFGIASESLRLAKRRA